MSVFFSLWTLALSLLPVARPDTGFAGAAAPAVASPAPAETLDTGFVPGRAPFEARFGDEEVRYGVMGVFVLPGERVAIEASEQEPIAIAAGSGALEPQGGNRWLWSAPLVSGPARIEMRRPSDGATLILNAFVLVPYERMSRGRINGYRIGVYPRSARHGAPAGFVEVTPATASLLVSPHFTLGQFVCKEGSRYPKYLVLRPALVVRLEYLLETLNRRGIEAGSFRVMSAYRTPLYNREIGNVTTFTRHQYGDAADIFVDEAPADGRMDDLDGDGRFDRGDADLLRAVAEETEEDSAQGSLVGGLSAYSANDAHGGFVHVDTRGYRARW